MRTLIAKQCLAPRLGRLWLGVVLVIVTAVAGCGRNPLGRLAISGKVTLNGRPLEQGTIAFEPTVRQTGVASGSNIVDGSYSIPTEKGLPPGEVHCAHLFGRPPENRAERRRRTGQPRCHRPRDSDYSPRVQRP